MKKLLCIILSAAMLIMSSAAVFAEREYEGETQLKDNMLYKRNFRSRRPASE